MADDDSKLIPEIKSAEETFNSGKGGDKKGCFLNSLKAISGVWRKDPSSDKVIEQLYLTTAKIIEYGINSKVAQCISELSDDDASGIIKFFYLTYSRITTGKDCLSLKPGKIFPLHEDLVAKKGIGMLHRALFSTERKLKKKGEKGEDD